MKAILMSIKPKWCEKIFNGEKTVEVRKTAPKLELPFKVYVYQTKHKGRNIVAEALNAVYGGGKVIGEFICDKIGEIDYVMYWNNGYEIATRLAYRECADYGKGKPLYGWHITAPKLYDKPKELSEFLTPSGTGDVWGNHYLSRPPQSFMYVEDEEQ